MKLSIITVCFNSAATIEDTIKAVLSQTYTDIEYIVIDGASKDNTLSIIQLYEGKLLYISEKDNGIYDAMNKGISLATGDVIGTLNADDFYVDENVLNHVAKVFEDAAVEACYGDLVYVEQVNTINIVRFWKSCSYKLGLFKLGWMPAHPTFFARRAIYESYGLFDLKYTIAADFELLFRFIEKHRVNTIYLPKVLVKMRLGGTTNKSVLNIWKQNKEIISILRNNYPDFSVVKFLANKILNRTLQFVRQPKL